MQSGSDQAFREEFIREMGNILGLNVPQPRKSYDSKLKDTLASVVLEIERLRKLVESYDRPAPLPESGSSGLGGGVCPEESSAGAVIEPVQRLAG